MNTNDLILGFLHDNISMLKAKSLVIFTFEIQAQEFDMLLYGAFTKAWQSYNQDLASFNTHVLTCLKSECLDYLRKEKAAPASIEYADKVAVGGAFAQAMYMKATLETVIDKIIEHEEGDMLFRVLVCGDNYAVACENPAHARKVVERFRAVLREEFGDIFN